MRALAVSPQGNLYVDHAEEASAPIDDHVATRVGLAFEQGTAAALVHLGLIETTQFLPPSYAFCRDLARDMVSRLRAHPDAEALRDRLTLEPKPERMQQLADSVPPMKGAEYVGVDVLAAWWKQAFTELGARLAAHRGSVDGYLHEQNPAWTSVGRVYFHLAENKASTEQPFAFLATYTDTKSVGRPQHRQLGRAVEESASARDRQMLRTLLLPVQRAGQRSPLIARLLASGEIYHPLAWTAAEAHAFLHEVPALEASGVIVRVPDWWHASQPPRPQVKITLGKQQPSLLGLDALLDFSVELSFGGEVLTPAEIRAILRGASGLRLVKGRWVDVDTQKLREVLDHWERAAAVARAGLSFHEAMRMLAGDGSSVDDLETTRAWTRVEAGAWLTQALDGLRSPDGLAAVKLGPELHAELRPYQQVGVRWLVWLVSLGLSGCLADDMGLGKTIQVLALLLVLKKKRSGRPSLLVMPASLLSNWQSELARFAPSLRSRIVHGSAADALTESDDRAALDLVMTTYGVVMRTAWLRETAWNLVVLDEAQAIKNPATKQTRAAKQLRAHARLALTGTPVENRLGDLWSLFDFLTPGLLGGAKEFGRMARALSARDEGFAVLRRLVSPYLLRRLKTDKNVISDLPDKTEVKVFCPLGSVQATLYQKTVDWLAGKLDAAEDVERRGIVLAALTRFKQICNHPSHWLGDGVWSPTASGKLTRVRELCEEIAQRQEKVLVFTQYREITEPLARVLADVFGRPGLVLHGGTSIRERKKRVEAFQSELGPPFFVLSLKAGGTGLNLTAASHVIHFDRWWNPAVEEQATDRAFRIGQKRNVLVHKLICRGTLEERIDALIESKRALSQQLLAGGNEIALTELSNAELLQLVSLDLAKALQEKT